MSKKKQLWTLRVKAVNEYEVWFDRPVTKEEAEWLYETEDDTIGEITIGEYIALDKVLEVR